MATGFAESSLAKLNEERTCIGIHPTVQRKRIAEMFKSGRRFNRIIVSVSFPKANPSLLSTYHLKHRLCWEHLDFS